MARIKVQFVVKFTSELEDSDYDFDNPTPLAVAKKEQEYMTSEPDYLIEALAFSLEKSDDVTIEVNPVD